MANKYDGMTQAEILTAMRAEGGGMRPAWWYTHDFDDRGKLPTIPVATPTQTQNCVTNENQPEVLNDDIL